MVEASSAGSMNTARRSNHAGDAASIPVRPVIRRLGRSAARPAIRAGPGHRPVGGRRDAPLPRVDGCSPGPLLLFGLVAVSAASTLARLPLAGTLLPTATDHGRVSRPV